MCSLGFLALDYSSVEPVLASFGKVAIEDISDKTQLLKCTSRLQAGRDNIVPIVSVDPTVEEG